MSFVIQVYRGRLHDDADVVKLVYQLAKRVFSVIMLPDFCLHVINAKSRPYQPHFALKIEYFLELFHCVFWTFHAVSNGPTVLVDLIIISSFIRLVAEEMYGCVVCAAERFLRFEVLEAVGLVPARWKDVEGNLTTDGETVSVCQ